VGMGITFQVQIVPIHGKTLIQACNDIPNYMGIAVFINRDSRRGVGDVYCHEPALEGCFCNEIPDPACDIQKLLILRRV